MSSLFSPTKKLRVVLNTTLSIAVLGCVFSIVATLYHQPQASALSGSDFNPGRIIDDGVFTNNGTMSAQAIQNFLNAKVPNCDTNGTQQSTHPNGAGGYYTRAQWGAMNGNNAPYTCLKNYVENTSTKQNNFAGAVVPGSTSAAQIIYDAAQKYRINPQVILVTLQKEQGLVTDDWPWYGEYQSAMGYGCPDTAACDTKYYGFYNQVDNAGWQFRYYLDHPNAFNYWVGNNYIQYNPSASCGGSVVNIQNAATAALYIYTPYQPNAGALSSLNDSTAGGTASCGAYGNRNFWWYFSKWFGSTLNPSFSAQYYTQSSYPVIDSGGGYSVFFEYKNIGSAFWKDDRSTFPGYWPVHMASTWPINRVSGFRADNWLSPSRATGTFAAVYEADGTTLSSDQHTVFSGQIAKFAFTLYADPNTPGGVYREYFQPVLEGAGGYSWNMEGTVYLDTGVNRPFYRAAYFSQSAYPTINKGASSAAVLKFKNTGTALWFDETTLPPGKHPVHLATAWPINRPSIFSSTGWANSARPNTTFSKVYEADGTTLAANQHVVYPGQVGEYDFNLTVPANAASGFYQEHFGPIVEGAPGYSWNTGADAWLGVTVP